MCEKCKHFLNAQFRDLNYFLGVWIFQLNLVHSVFLM